MKKLMCKIRWHDWQEISFMQQFLSPRPVMKMFIETRRCERCGIEQERYGFGSSSKDMFWRSWENRK
tara:strand:+ start:332 stop:532 length:201 start_codon:yes stop_codon:yes gene_type:complete